VLCGIVIGTTEHSLRDLARDVLGRVGWLSRQPAALRELVLTSAALRRVEAKASVYHQGDDPDGMYGVVLGCIKVETVHDDGRRTALGLISEGGWFGEVSTIEGGSPRATSAIAMSSSVVLQISPALFAQIIEQDPRRLLNFATLLSDRVRTMQWLREELAEPDPVRRLTRVLLWLANLQDWAELSAEVVIPVTQDQIASIANLSRATINHALKQLEKNGRVECRYGAIILVPAA
jgi:CRP-like cAMP-binding protein